MTFRFYPLISIAVSSAVLALFVGRIISYSRNTLESHPEWISGKRLLAVPTMGSGDACFSRNLLKRDRLNLHEWHGYNEILLNRIFEPQLVRFRFYVGDNSYLIVVFNKTSDSFTGIRLSRRPDYPTMLFHAATSGKFLSRQTIGNIHLSDSWHRAELRFLPDSVAVQIDEERIGSFDEPRLSKQIFGFRSGKNKVLIDDVEIKDVSGNSVIREDFQNRCRDTRTVIATFLLLLTMSIFIMRPKRNTKRGIFAVLLVHFSLFLVLGLYYAFDYYYWSANYHFMKLRPWQAGGNEYLSVMEQARIFLFTRFPFFENCSHPSFAASSNAVARFLALPESHGFRSGDLIVFGKGDQRNGIAVADSSASIEAYLKRWPATNQKRILFLGTSQLWGEGGGRLEDRIVDQIFVLLTRHFEPTGLLLINASKQASRSQELLARCTKGLYLFRPQIVVADLSNNDPAKGFRESLQSLSQWAESSGAQMVFVLEPNSMEESLNSIIRKHEIMKEVGKQQKAVILDLHGYLSRRDVYDSGLLFWDRVHMTSYGQSLAARFISQGVLNHAEHLK